MEHIVIIGNGIELRLDVIFEKNQIQITIVSWNWVFSFLVPL
jgi:hypothetical protein